jgi:hypothetical protein
MDLHSVGLKQFTDLSKERCTNLAPFQQVTGIKHGRRIRYSFMPEVNPAEARNAGMSYKASSHTSSARLNQLTTKYIRSIRSKPTGGRPFPTFG